MKKYTQIFLFILLNTFLSCIGNNDSIVDDLSISGNSIKIDSSNVFKFPRMITGNIIISDQLWGSREYYAGVIKNNEWTKSESVFKVGHGHNEFEWLRIVKGYDNSLLLLDGISKLRSMTVISNADSIDRIKDVSQWKKYSLNGLGAFTCTDRNFYPVSDSTILIVGTPYDTPGHLLSIINYKTQKCTPLDYWPNDGIDIDSLPKHCVYGDGGKTFGNGTGHFLFLCARERYAFIFSINGNKVNVIKDLYTTYSEYKTKDHLNPITRRVRTEGLAGDANKNYIYLLLTDTNRKGNRIDIKKWRNQHLYGNVIELYDWDGNLQKRLRLDHSGQRIILSDDGKSLYLLSDDYFEGETNPEIWVYNLTDI